MTRRITIVQGHPDPAGQHLLHAMADAYADAATAAGHQVRRIEVAKLEYPDVWKLCKQARELAWDPARDIDYADIRNADLPPEVRSAGAATEVRVA